jgi:hypothetical protein
MTGVRLSAELTNIYQKAKEGRAGERGVLNCILELDAGSMFTVSRSLESGVTLLVPAVSSRYSSSVLEYTAPEVSKGALAEERFVVTPSPSCSEAMLLGDNSEYDAIGLGSCPGVISVKCVLDERRTGVAGLR